MRWISVAPLFALAVYVTRPALAVSSSELYPSAAYGYGRMEARVKFAAGDGVISSFFLWKDGSEVSGTFWNELDFEKLGADCHLETNALYGAPVAGHTQKHTLGGLCTGYHVYTYEWTPDAIVWLVDGVEIRRETGATAQAFSQNAAAKGMQLRFNVWPGDASFGGNFSPSILPVHQYIDWVQLFSYADGKFTLKWREDFNGTALPQGWLKANWASPKNLSTHHENNVNFIDGYAVLSLTADDKVGPAGATPRAGDTGGMSSGGSMNSGGSSGATASGGTLAQGGAAAQGGVSVTAGSPGAGGALNQGGVPTAGGTMMAAGGATNTGGAPTSGGAAPSGGTNGLGGKAAAGSDSRGGSGVTSGGSTPSGMALGGGGASAGAPTAADPSGCSCALVGADRPNIDTRLLLLALAAVTFVRRRVRHN